MLSNTKSNAELVREYIYAGFQNDVTSKEKYGTLAIDHIYLTRDWKPELVQKKICELSAL